MLKWGLILFATLLLVVPPVDIIRQQAPWGPGTVWAFHESLDLDQMASTNPYFRSLAIQVLGPEVGTSLAIYEIPSSPRGERNAFASWWPLAVGLVNLADLPLPTQAIVLLHELGHIAQYQGTRASLSNTEAEIDADAFSARWACWLGIDIEWDRTFWMTVLTPGDWGGYKHRSGHGMWTDNYHPSPVSRVFAMERAWEAAGCSKLQAP